MGGDKENAVRQNQPERSVEAISREMTQREDYMQEKLEVDGMCEASC